MLTPSQISELAEKKYPTFKQSNIAFAARNAYIAAFTDAIELMSKEWVSVEDSLPEKSGGYVCVINYDNGPKTTCMSFNLKRESFVILHKRVTHWQPLPEPPVLTKDKKI